MNQNYFGRHFGLACPLIYLPQNTIKAMNFLRETSRFLFRLNQQIIFQKGRLQILQKCIKVPNFGPQVLNCWKISSYDLIKTA